MCVFRIGVFSFLLKVDDQSSTNTREKTFMCNVEIRPVFVIILYVSLKILKFIASSRLKF